MEFIKKSLDILLHLDKHLDGLISQYGPWIYLILFLIVFCETGLVVTPFLPGDSLMFTVGALAARPDGLNLWVVLVLLLVAAIAGDSVNYWIGAYAGDRLTRRFPRLIRQEHLDRTHAFYERYGGKTIIIARFVPIVRTLAPFVAGVGKMTYARFMSYNVIGALLWVGLLIPAGYWFGNLAIVRQHFGKVILLIIFLSIVPAVVEFYREWRRARSAAAAQDALPPR
jgi:membrane-associated protein